MRVSELLGLQWDDIDFEKRQILVQRQIYKGESRDTTKTGKNRTIDMTPHLTETLKAFRREKRKYSLKTGAPFSEFCFTLGTRLKPMSAPVIRNAMLLILEKAGLPKMRIHDMRHSYATIRLLKGHDISDVSYQLGHSSIKITFDVYTHWIPGKFKSQVDDLDTQPNATYTQPEKMERDV